MDSDTTENGQLTTDELKCVMLHYFDFQLVFDTSNSLLATNWWFKQDCYRLHRGTTAWLKADTLLLKGPTTICFVWK